MPRVVHFELAAADVARAQSVYEDIFGWKFDKWEGGEPYWLITTGDDPMGINGGMMVRSEGYPNAVNTIGVADVDAVVKAVVDHGGAVASPKVAITGMGYLAYLTDTEGNLFGVMAPDPTAVYQP